MVQVINSLKLNIQNIVFKPISKTIFSIEYKIKYKTKNGEIPLLVQLPEFQINSNYDDIDIYLSLNAETKQQQYAINILEELDKKIKTFYINNLQQLKKILPINKKTEAGYKSLILKLKDDPKKKIMQLNKKYNISVFMNGKEATKTDIFPQRMVAVLIEIPKLIINKKCIAMCPIIVHQFDIREEIEEEIKLYDYSFINLDDDDEKKQDIANIINNNDDRNENDDGDDDEFDDTSN